MRRRTLLAGMLAERSKRPPLHKAIPDRAIRLIVPSAPGGPTPRGAAARANPAPGSAKPPWWRKTPLRRGADGARAVATAAPAGAGAACRQHQRADGVRPSVSAKAGYDPAKAFAPVAKISERDRGPSGASVIALDERDGIRGRCESPCGQVECGARRRGRASVFFSSCSSRRPASISSACRTRAAAKP